MSFKPAKKGGKGVSFDEAHLAALEEAIGGADSTDDPTIEELDEDEDEDGGEYEPVEDDDALLLLASKLDDTMQCFVTSDGVAIADVLADIAAHLSKLVKVVSHAARK